MGALPALLLLGSALACASTPSSDESSGGAPPASGGSTAGHLGAGSAATAGVGGAPTAGGGNAAAGRVPTGGTSAATAGVSGASGAGAAAIGGRPSAGSAGRENAGNAGTSGQSQGGSGGAAGQAGFGAAGGGRGGSANAGTSGLAGAGAGAAGSGAGTGGANAYHPCPTDGSPCKIMPYGDSITFGVGDEGNGGYRGPLFAAAVAAGQSITFTGSLSNGPTTVSGQTFPKKNEGHSGWGISQVTPYSGNNAGIATVIPNPGFSSGSGGVPHVILLHIGTNDAGTFTAAQMTSDLSGLLDKIISNAPDAYLVVAQIIPLGYGSNDVIKTYNQSIPGLVKQRADAGKHITSVDMFTGFTTAGMLGSDSIHPNTAGYKFMADHWYAVVGPLLLP
jgi:hypothetical protein